MIHDLMDVAIIHSPDRQEVIIAELVSRVLKNQSLPNGVTVKAEVASELPALFVDPQQTEQVLGNLVTNAYQAMPEGGVLTISANVNKDMVVISVKDTGCGIYRKNMGKLFEPLFTTKKWGMGLGLTVSRRVVQENGGRIEAVSREKGGSNFLVMLPVKKAG